MWLKRRRLRPFLLFTMMYVLVFTSIYSPRPPFLHLHVCAPKSRKAICLLCNGLVVALFSAFFGLCNLISISIRRSWARKQEDASRVLLISYKHMEYAIRSIQGSLCKTQVKQLPSHFSIRQIASTPSALCESARAVAQLVIALQCHHVLLDS